MRLSVQEARAGFKKLLDAVEAGESVVITRRGEEVAVVSPPKAVQETQKPETTVLVPATHLPASEIPQGAVCSHQVRGGICGAKAVFARGTRYFCEVH